MLSPKLEEIIKVLKETKQVIGIAIYSKFGSIKYDSLPTWVDSKAIVKLIDSILNASNKAIKKLRHGEIVRTTIESTEGNILVTIIGEDILIVITEKDFNVKLLDKKEEKKVLEFKF